MAKGKKVEVSFIQIAAGSVGLYGLAKDGSVWRYYPADYSKPSVVKFAWWGRLTANGSDATGTPGEREQ